MKASTKMQIEGQWDQVKGKVKENWAQLTDNDLKKAEGKYDQLVGVIKERTGETRDAIEQKLEQLANRR